MKNFHLHLVSDSTGETVSLVARACLAQFEDVIADNHDWTLVRTEEQVEEILVAIEENRGFVLCTLVDSKLRLKLEEGCRQLQIPCVALLDPIIGALGRYLGAEIKGRPGRQHEMDAEYFNRIDAMQFVLSHDDGQMSHDLEEADVLVLGVSRTSKTPTCIYLANRGIKAANVPLVSGQTPPDELERVRGPLVIGLVNSVKRLVELRRSRLLLLNEEANTTYVDEDEIKKEIASARRLFTRHQWPVIDVTGRSIEETAAAILKLHAQWERSV